MRYLIIVAALLISGGAEAKKPKTLTEKNGIVTDVRTSRVEYVVPKGSTVLRDPRTGRTEGFLREKVK